MKRWVRTGMTALLLLLGMTGIWLQASPGDVRAASAGTVLAVHDEITVLAGAPEGREWVCINRERLLQGNLMLVSAYHPLPLDFPAPNVRRIESVVGRYLPAHTQAVLTRETVQALCDLHAAHALTDVQIIRGGLSRAQQDALRLERFEKYSAVCTLEEALERSRAETPAGGESEHQLGTAFDIVWTGFRQDGKKDPLARTELGMWLDEQMWRFGLIRRGGSVGEEHVCDGLHLRYVGAVHAAAMHAGSWTLEAYLELLETWGAVTVQIAGERDAYVYRVPYDGADTLTVLLPSRFPDCSMDNRGGAVFTVMAQE